MVHDTFMKWFVLPSQCPSRPSVIFVAHRAPSTQRSQAYINVLTCPLYFNTYDFTRLHKKGVPCLNRSCSWLWYGPVLPLEQLVALFVLFCNIAWEEMLHTHLELHRRQCSLLENMWTSATSINEVVQLINQCLNYLKN